MEKYKTCTAHNAQEIKDHVNKHHTLYLWGKYGKGKTHFLKHVQYKLGGFYCMSAQLHKTLLDEIEWKNSTGSPKKSIVTKMQEAKILLLDDLGNEYMSEFVHEALSIVIDHRYYLHNLDTPPDMRTIITSNYSLNDLYKVWTKKIGEVKAGQLVSRLKSFGAIELKGDNWR